MVVRRGDDADRRGARADGPAHQRPAGMRRDEDESADGAHRDRAGSRHLGDAAADQGALGHEPLNKAPPLATGTVGSGASPRRARASPRSARL